MLSRRLSDPHIPVCRIINDHKLNTKSTFFILRTERPAHRNTPVYCPILRGVLDYPVERVWVFCHCCCLVAGKNTAEIDVLYSWVFQEVCLIWPVSLVGVVQYGLAHPNHIYHGLLLMQESIHVSAKFCLHFPAMSTRLSSTLKSWSISYVNCRDLVEGFMRMRNVLTSILKSSNNHIISRWLWGRWWTRAQFYNFLFWLARTGW